MSKKKEASNRGTPGHMDEIVGLGAKVAETIDIYGRSWWKCWECAVRI
ncbi:MAG: hypothetical protein O7B35_05825 [Deltaproteobacteria bacterium]|nr:hypothetical protein [Deltaproteobacteria bacterium]